MTDAFQCDRCNEFQSGSGKEFRVGEYLEGGSFKGNYSFEAKKELCSECYSEVMEKVLMELDASSEATKQ